MVPTPLALPLVMIIDSSVYISWPDCKLAKQLILS